MKRKATASTLATIILLTSLTISVSAFYFDFQDFETDKLVYEVGETIDMVARLIADFSDEGWCFVSFAVVTDLGPSFADEYFISSSPMVRYLNSSYTIQPGHTSPNVTGVQSFVLFTVEIFDTVFQSAGDNIEITINRGHLTAIPLSSLSVQYGQNTSISLKITSVHNSNIVYVDELVNLNVVNSDSQTVLNKNLTTSSEGIIQLNWNNSYGSPGLYNLTVSSNGNEDFLPFTDSFQITVLPAMSNLTIISSPVSVYCMSPDREYLEQALIVVEHTDLESNTIDDSTIEWTTLFGSGTLTNFGNGQYSAVIPFNTSPGSYQINFTAMNSQYQPVEKSTIVNVLANQITLTSMQPYWNATKGENVTIEFLIEPHLNWNQSIQLQFIDEALGFMQLIEVQPKVPSFLTIPICHNVSVGLHILNTPSANEFYQFSANSQILLVVTGNMNATASSIIAYYNETLEFDLEIRDDNNQTVSFVDIAIFCDYNMTLFGIVTSVNSSMTQTVSLPTWISPSIHNFTLIISKQYFKTINLSISTRVWIRTNIIIVITINK
ncbi:MAG: hypothetical protein ACFFDQ_00100 [Candidatus Thorarchaeota archaeon]